jgi:predicted SAM-dependent methyltransferase
MKSYKLNYPELLQIPFDGPDITIEQLRLELDNSIDEIYCSNILEIYNNPTEFLSMLQSKLRLSGKFYIIGNNIDSVVENYLDQIIDINFLNKCLRNKYQIYTIESIIDLLNNNFFDYESIKTDSIYFYITAKRRVYNNE